MEQVQRRYVKFKTDTLEIQSIGFDLNAEDGYSVVPADWNLVEPFFTLEKNVYQYYPLVSNGKLIGFRRKELFESEVVKNTEDEVVRALRSFENFIADCRIPITKEEGKLFLLYDSNYFNSIDNQENIERLTSVNDKVYNLYVTRKGDPFTIFQSHEVTLDQFLSGGVLLDYLGPTEISIYVVAKDQ